MTDSPTVRLDGLVSLDTPLHRGGGQRWNGTIVMTRPLKATGGPLRLNIDTGAQGAAWVEICEATPGHPALPGFGMAEAVAVVMNDVDHVVEWANKTDSAWPVMYSAAQLALDNH
jgi:hypothetical protein